MTKKIKKLQERPPYYETSWETVASEMADKIEELIDAVNELSLSKKANS